MVSDADAPTAEPGRHDCRSIERGERIFAAGDNGHAWRVLVGVVRLDRDGIDGPEFGGLALAGDVIGAETLLFGTYTFTARALSAVTIEIWGEQREHFRPQILLHTLTAMETRVADALALRKGAPDRRIGRLLNLIGRGVAHGQRTVPVALPQLRDIAEITALTVETVSRTISRLKSDGALVVWGGERSRQVWIDVDAQ